MGVTAKKDKEKYEKILNIKMKTKLEDICKGVPNEFITFIQYARNLKFDDKPDYDFLRKIILIIAENYGLNLDKEEFDWDNFGKAFKFDVEKP